MVPPDRPTADARQGSKRDRKRGAILPPWIRKRLESESQILRTFELMGVPPPPRIGTKAHDQRIERVIEQGKKFLVTDKDKSQDIPF